jgi:hypothetical protein
MPKAVKKAAKPAVKKEASSSFHVLNLLQMIFEIVVGIGFIIGLFPFGYLAVAVWFVVPLTIINMIFSIISKNGSMPFTIVNVIMAWFALIPIVGIFFRLVGIVMSTISAVMAGKKMRG